MPSPAINFSHICLRLALLCCLAGCGAEPFQPERLSEHAFAEIESGVAVTVELPQAPGRVVLARVEGFETAFRSGLSSGPTEPASSARLPYIRTGPVFHVLRTDELEAGARLAVVPVQATSNGRISVTFYDLPGNDRRDRIRIESYRAYEAAIKSTDDESAPEWRARAGFLEQAAAGFKRSGDTEALIWAQFLNAYIHYFPLAEYDRAVHLAREVQRDAESHELPEARLMAMQLEGQALIERHEGDSPESARVRAGEAQAALARAVEAARSMGYRYEEASALNARGIGYFYQDLYDEAERYYAMALEHALELDDPSFETQVRGNLALVQERQGDLYGALEELQAINAELRRSGAENDLAHNWSELSRLYERLYLFPQSIEAQGEALAIWSALKSAEGMGRSGLSLAHAYQAIGNPERARAVLADALVDLQAAGFSRGLRDGYGLLAQLYRREGQYERMSEARARQGELLSSAREQAGFFYERGLDALAAKANDRGEAGSLFEQARTAAEEAGDPGLAARAQLQICAMSDGVCAPSELEPALHEMLQTATPRQSVEARFLFAQILDRSGELAEAQSVIETLIDDVRFYRQTLPGALGAWYWEGRAKIFEFYMDLALAEGSESHGRPINALLAFNKLVNTSLSGGAPLRESEAGTAALRGLLARLEEARPAQETAIRQAIDRELLQLRTDSQLASRSLVSADLESMLNEFPDDTGLLAYYLQSDEAWVWLATSSGVRMHALGNSDVLAAALEKASRGFRVVGNAHLDQDLAHLGELLLDPVGQDLPGTLYLLSSGRLAGFPFEAIRYNDRYLAEDRVVINTLSLEALRGTAEPDNGADSWSEIVLAGDPLAAGNDLSALPSASRELDGLARLFEGRSIFNARKALLDSELFHSAEFTGADLIHIASHAQINLEYPELSRLLLSSSGGQAAYLTPLDLRGLALQARLVTLSACETSGVNAFSFDSNLGFVSAFLQSGADAVVATLWPVADAFAASLALELYGAVLEGASIPQALAHAKRRHLAGTAAGRIPDWPAFQIYIN